jgi:hydroxymethylglutaryl-CoA synthase
MDFWRPNYMQEGLVDGKYSIKVYLNALEEAWKHYQQNSGRTLQDHAKFAYHLPFTKMALKAHQRLCSINGCSTMFEEDALADSLIYGKRIGNSYTASLFVALTSLLENCKQDLSKKRIGLFSYGSGCMAEYFSAVVQPHYKDYLMTSFHNNLLNQRQKVTVDQYEQFYGSSLPQDGTPYTMPMHNNGLFRFTGLDEHKRLYSNVQ